MSLKNLVQIVLLFIPTTVFGQIKLDGPKNIEPGELGKINIEGINGLNDPKIECFPANDAWEAVRRLDGTPFILFYTKKEGLYTFVVAGNKDNKTILSAFQIIVGKVVPPAPPKPVPVPGGKYTARLKASYMVSPDETSLNKLISIYQDVAYNAQNAQSYKHLMDALVLETSKALVDTTLRKLRDEVANILQSDLANRNSQTYDPNAARAIFQELAVSLEGLK